ncbi:acetyl-CoA hydrolase/transferase family protein [Mesorhizobium australicum]|uniref:Acetyl-CoA hydrolase/transferase C-terminal domain-containing protein n=1 Tax=Mesorhizobium australicum TaxID=536018 RepID=A0A1X7N2T6_9HYPH|nr:acetyl-CoA hydrolase/transferase C-terminal domain-containing protein [Mesorhizobium australicum]SMH30736.1 Acetyl-CoA hydrolase/transferase C-terminal domain-containing protein [Mesorhizobium australicum]
MTTAAARIISSIPHGSSVFLPGSAAEIRSLSTALVAPDAPPLHLTTSYVPGINPTLAGKLPNGGRLAGPFAAGPRGVQASGSMNHLPMSYGTFRRHLPSANFDWLVVHVAPPDGNGRASLGPSVEFTPIVLKRAARLAVVVNPNIPVIPGASTIDISAADVVTEIDEPLVEYDVGAPSPQSDAIARAVASLIDDGAALQIGLGKVPDALLRLLADRRCLRLQSGMLSDGTRLLQEAGALDADFIHTSCVHVGTRAYYDWLAGRDGLAVLGCDHTHSPAVLGSVDRLITVNSALSVDLFGQANLEMLDGRAISGVGGAADFSRAASLSPTGISIVALPSVSNDGAISRVVGSIDGVVSIPRHDIDVIVTEHGIADLRGATTIERGERLISVAAPQHRADLETAWRQIAGRL